ncbi:IclR family transcriptional regulator [Ruegeria sp. 2205SS24-7]|uniref:IclR family transcriptional regulator n=1 Tax=Ruegeria discodermiae TaxID=3064389 RepID=UPI00274263E8|nr:IclR family transcriptional regulator [Ruegeria sp. 2205SS24-7]MDP5220712.1 IclR family transcriptional regulator [Ruegeria sp. 2205SS24-7]
MVDNVEKKEKGGIQVIERAASILRALKENQNGMSLGQIARRVDLPRSTVQRITSALAAENMVISDVGGHGLRLGPELTSLAGSNQYNVVEHCRLLLTELTQKTGETADLSVMRGMGMVFLDQVPGTHRLTTISHVGEVFPLTTTANGKACLSQLEEADARRLINAEWKRTGMAGEISALLNELDNVRTDGLAYDINEHSTGVSAVGFAFRDWGGELHAISVPVPSTRFEEIRSTVERSLLQTSKSVRQQFA